MNRYLGIDIGASTTKAVIIDENKNILGFSVTDSGADFQGAADRVLHKAQEESGLDDSTEYTTVTTGYGRRNVAYADDTITEISCHARGSYHYFSLAHTLVDIGGQDSKIIKIDDKGKRTNFKMNRKCAAGTGAFLEEIANRLKIKLEDLNQLAEKAEHDIQIGSYCTVFSATEILGKIREGIAVPDIMKGVFCSVIKRIFEMDSLDGDIVATGGVVAYNPYLVKLFEEKIGKKVMVPPQPQLAGALGAALFARELK